MWSLRHRPGIIGGALAAKRRRQYELSFPSEATCSQLPVTGRSMGCIGALSPLARSIPFSNNNEFIHYFMTYPGCSHTTSRFRSSEPEISLF